MLRRAARIQLPRLRCPVITPAVAPPARLFHTPSQNPSTAKPSPPPLADRALDHDIEEAPPHVSSYAVGATVFFIGGLSYYLYTEYGHVITDRLPFGPGSAVSDSLSEADRRAKDEARRQRRLRAAMLPKSAMSPAEQVNWAWTHPGLYVTGSNAHGLIDPLHPGSGSGFKASVVGFEGKVLRSAAFATTHAAAVDTDGNVFQWGTGFVGANSPHRPVATLRDPNIHTLAASNDYIALLDSKSRIRLLPGSTDATSKVPVTLPFEPRLGWRENVVSLSAGEDHLAVTTSAGNVFTCSLSDKGNNRFQLGHGENSADTKSLVLKRVDSDRKFSAAICGDRHTLLLAEDGNVYGCGANDFGQLAMGSYSESTKTVRDLVPLQKLWKNGYFDSATARAELLAAGSATSYIQIRQGNNLNLVSCGRGIDGQLGSGALVHMQGTPVVIDALSGKHEYDQNSNSRKPLGIRSISASGDHVVAVCDNQTNVTLDKSGSAVEKVPLYGYDVFVWGSNRLGQCIPDRRHRLAEPTHPLPLYKSLLESKNPGDPDFAPRLQAAPRQWVLESSFGEPNSEAGTKPAASRSGPKVLVEQAFVAGPEVTAAYLRQV
ncbi:hypothetical protein LPJ73_000703 [Coemansia sp. RSA 2703]|nr:hypothetical protein LPJ73_000703 [Coemansia sp. RSA 2703]KAJ2375012.1 hypothetical protein IW150_002783 [Coemansia sp. RSA 2607]KAJ2396983.1 hypothetical protein GGI05_000869 [Coemansia sp. RSA 2603]